MTEYYLKSNKYSTQTRKLASGKTVYDISFRAVEKATGKEIQKRMRGFATKALAKQGYIDFVAQKCEVLRCGEIKKINAEKNEPLVGDLLRLYLVAAAVENKESVIYDKTAIFERYFLPKYNDKKISVLTADELKQWQIECLATKSEKIGKTISVKYYQKIRSHVGAFLAWVEDEYKYKNHLPEVKRPTARPSTLTYTVWDVPTFKKFIDVVDEPMYRTLFTMMYYTGRRKGEVFALAPTDINLTKKTITWSKSITDKLMKDTTEEHDGRRYKVTTTKEDKVQTLPIGKTLYEELLFYEPMKPFYFGGEHPLDAGTVTRRFNKYCELAEVPRIRIHDLRHSFASLLIDRKENFLVIAELIGDTVEQVIKTYGHLYKDALVNAVKDL